MSARAVTLRGMSELIAALQDAADPTLAAGMARYFKTGPGEYGEGDRFAGITVPTLRRIAKPYGRSAFVVGEWLPLLRHDLHEYRAVALLAMTYRYRFAEPQERAALHRCYLANTAYVNNWDLVDLSCRTLVGRHLLDDEPGRGGRGLLDRLAGSDSVWERRIAIVSTQEFLPHGQSADSYRIAQLLIDDPHDLIHKAVGWTLREAGKRVSDAELLSFLDRNAVRLPRTALRYAIERLPPEQRRHYLTLR